MNLPMISVEHIKTDTLPALFLDNDAIGQYGAGAIVRSSVDRYSDLISLTLDTPYFLCRKG